MSTWREKFRIYSLSRGHLNGARRLYSRLFHGTNLRFLGKYASRKTTYQDRVAMVATKGRRLVGLVCCSLLEGGVSWPELIGVQKAYRRQGVATALWRRMEKKLRSLKVNSVWTRSRVLGAEIDLFLYPEAVVFLLKPGCQKRNDIYDMEAVFAEVSLDTSPA